MVKYEHIKSASIGLKCWFYYPNWLCESVASCFGLMEVYLPPTFFYGAGELIKSLMLSRHVLYLSEWPVDFGLVQSQRPILLGIKLL